MPRPRSARDDPAEKTEREHPGGATRLTAAASSDSRWHARIAAVASSRVRATAIGDPPSVDARSCVRRRPCVCDLPCVHARVDRCPCVNSCIDCETRICSGINDRRSCIEPRVHARVERDADSSAAHSGVACRPIDDDRIAWAVRCRACAEVRQIADARGHSADRGRALEPIGRTPHASRTALGDVAQPGRGATHRGRRRYCIGRTINRASRAALGHVARSGRQPAHRARGKNCIGRTGRAASAARLSHIAKPRRRTADDRRAREAIGWARDVRPVTRLGDIARPR